MCIKQSIEKKLINFGKNNSPTFVAMSIAAAKGIFRPAFTMMDTKESYQTKKICGNKRIFLSGNLPCCIFSGNPSDI